MGVTWVQAHQLCWMSLFLSCLFAAKMPVMLIKTKFMKLANRCSWKRTQFSWNIHCGGQMPWLLRKQIRHVEFLFIKYFFYLFSWNVASWIIKRPTVCSNKCHKTHSLTVDHLTSLFDWTYLYCMGPRVWYHCTTRAKYRALFALWKRCLILAQKRGNLPVWTQQYAMIIVTTALADCDRLNSVPSMQYSFSVFIEHIFDISRFDLQWHIPTAKQNDTQLRTFHYTLNVTSNHSHHLWR